MTNELNRFLLTSSRIKAYTSHHSGHSAKQPFTYPQTVNIRTELRAYEPLNQLALHIHKMAPQAVGPLVSLHS